MSAPEWAEVKSNIMGALSACGPIQAVSIATNLVAARLRPLWERQQAALAEARRRADATEGDIRCKLLQEMSEEQMRAAMGDAAFERDAAQAGEVIQKALAEHCAHERDVALAAKATAETREGAARNEIADALLELLEALETEAERHKRERAELEALKDASSYAVAIADKKALERACRAHARRLRECIGLPPRDQS